MAAADYFAYLPTHGLAACRRYRCVVWPNKACAHLQGKQHELRPPEAVLIVDNLRQWAGLHATPAAFHRPHEVPAAVVNQIDLLPLYRDGLACRLQPLQCWYVCQTLSTMKGHWRTHHSWRTSEARGGSGHAKAAKILARLSHAVVSVAC